MNSETTGGLTTPLNTDTLFLDRYFALYRQVLLESGVHESLLAFRNLCLQTKARGGKLIFAGNGASASISSQAATDYTQHGRIRAVAFNDHNLITAFGNDYGYENWVAKALEAYADPGDLVVLISSSGSSPNIVNAAKFAQENNLSCVTFTGFSADNPLRKLGGLNLWVDCNAYNVIETTHLTWILLVANLLEHPDRGLAFLDFSLKEVVNKISAEPHRDSLVSFRDICANVSKSGGKLIFAGNGGSSSIASHAATDFTKQSKIRSIAFNDHNLLTAFANDYGQENWLAKCVEAYCEQKDALVLISSSGRSRNVLNAASFVRAKRVTLITFTGFTSENPLRQVGHINFWAETTDVCITQAIHSSWIFCVADLLANIEM